MAEKLGIKMSYYLCIDIGGTSIKYGILDEKYNICTKNKIATPPCREEFLKCMGDIFTVLSGKYVLCGIAVSIPGRIAPDNRVQSGGCIGYLKDFDLAGYMHKLGNVPVSIENDAICAAMAELERGSLKGCNDAIAVIFGSGIGGAIISDGRIRRGAHNASAEFSFIIMGAGFYNDETLWSADNGDFHLRSLVSEMKQIPLESLDGIKIFDLANNGDAEVNIIIKNYTKIIARNLFNLQAVLDVEKIVIGGGISGQPLFINGIKEGINEYASMLNSPVVLPEIAGCRYAGEANLIGALVNHLQSG